MRRSPQIASSEAFAPRQDLVAALQPIGNCQPRTKGTVLFRQGEPSTGVYLLLEGEASLLISRDDGRTIPVRTVGSGYLLGLPGTILNREYLFSARLTRDSKVAFIPTGELLDFLRQHNDICFEVVGMLGSEVIDLPASVKKRLARVRTRRTSA